MNIRDILANKNKGIIHVNGYATASQAVAEMVAFNVGSVIVITDGVVEGIFTERDALRVWNNHDKVKDAPVMNLMSTNLIITTPDDTIENAMSVMSQNNIRHLLVMDGKKLLGVLSIRDLVQAYAGSLAVEFQFK